MELALSGGSVCGARDRRARELWNDPSGSKKNRLKPWLNEYWCIPYRAGAEFVYHLEDVLEVYKRRYTARCPQICMDETNKQIIANIHEPVEMKPGMVKREDYQYERKGTCNIFIACEPLTGKRFLKVTERRTKRDWALFMKELLDEQYSEAEKLILVMDNLNTHVFSSFYETFEPAEARRLSERFELHFTPKHASWLNMAEIELSALMRQALGERMGSFQEIERQVASWQEQRNEKGVTINWRFTTQDARIALKHLYPSYED